MSTESLQSLQSWIEQKTKQNKTKQLFCFLPFALCRQLSHARIPNMYIRIETRTPTERLVKTARYAAHVQDSRHGTFFLPCVCFTHIASCVGLRDLCLQPLYNILEFDTDCSIGFQTNANPPITRQSGIRDSPACAIEFCVGCQPA